MLHRPVNRPVVAYFDAIKSLRLRQVSLILKAGYDPNLMVNSRGQNGLQFMVNYFNSKEAHFRIQTPITKGAYLSIAKLMLDSGLDANTLDILTGESVIYDSIRLHDRDMVELLLHYADFSVRNKDGETALMCAARYATKPIMRLILSHLHELELDDYFLRQRNTFGYSPLDIARAQNMDCAKVLTKHLIGFGQVAPPPVLARSSSHHNLLARSLRPVGAPTGRPVRAGRSFVDQDTDIDDLDALDLHDDVDYMAHVDYGAHRAHLMAANYGHPLVRRHVAARSLAMSGGAPMDARAAEFNLYLLRGATKNQMNPGESPEQPSSSQQQPFGRQQSASDPDDEDPNGGTGQQLPTSGGYGYYGGAGAPMTRSRSCVFGPNEMQGPAQGGQQSQRKSQGKQK